MEIRFKSDASHHYMILKKEKGNEKSGHEKMVIRNQIAGLLKMNLHFLDNEAFYYYEIQSRQNLSRLCESRALTGREMKSLLQGIDRLFRELEQYLLPTDEVIFDPDCIYMDLETFEPAFVFYPSGHASERCAEDFYKLARFLIDHADRDDRECQTLAYDYFSLVEDGIYSPEKLLTGREIPVETAGNREPAPYYEADLQVPEEEGYWEMEEDRSELDYFSKEEEDTGKGTLKLAFVCLLLILASAGAYLVLVLNPKLIPGISLSENEYLIAGGVIAVLFGIALTAVIYIYNKKRTKADRKREAEREDLLSRSVRDPLDSKEAAVRQDPDFAQQEDDGKTTLLNMPVCERADASLSGMAGGREISFSVDRSPFLIGKKRERADGVIFDESVSRIHASIHERDGRYYLSDMNSTNGTYVNGRRLELNETVALEDGDRVGFAHVTLTFRNRKAYPAYGAF